MTDLWRRISVSDLWVIWTYDFETHILTRTGEIRTFQVPMLDLPDRLRKELLARVCPD